MISWIVWYASDVIYRRTLWQPTDVKNFFSGWPITRLGADLWTCYGRPKGTELTPTWSNTYGLDGYERATIPLSTSDSRTHPEFGLEFSSATRRQGRCCLEEGQMPFFLLWKCWNESCDFQISSRKYKLLSPKPELMANDKKAFRFLNKQKLIWIILAEVSKTTGCHKGPSWA